AIFLQFADIETSLWIANEAAASVRGGCGTSEAQKKTPLREAVSLGFKFHAVPLLAGWPGRASRPAISTAVRTGTCCFRVSPRRSVRSARCTSREPARRRPESHSRTCEFGPYADRSSPPSRPPCTAVRNAPLRRSYQSTVVPARG